MQTNDIIIEIDKITSGKVNIISFCRRDKQIDHAALPLKEKSEHPKSIYNYKHHLDYDGIQKLSSRFPQIYTYEDRESKTDWNSGILKQLERLIRDNKLDKVIEKEGIKYHIKLVWMGK
jgi:hypothetical protein